jgi:hypothetical protein
MTHLHPLHYFTVIVVVGGCAYCLTCWRLAQLVAKRIKLVDEESQAEARSGSAFVSSSIRGGEPATQRRSSVKLLDTRGGREQPHMTAAENG